jgi:drug/metabolite transporter (DMT)-like permease
MTSHRGKGIALVLSASALWGATGPLTKILRVHGFGLTDILSWRYLIGCVSLVICSRLLPTPPELRIDRRRFFGALVLALSILGVNAAFTWSNFFTTVANAQALTFTAPLFASVLAWVLLRETIRATHLGALGIGFSGVCLLAFSSYAGTAGPPTAISPNLPLGNALALLCGLLYGWYFVIARKVAQQDAAVLTGTIWQFLILSGLLSPLMVRTLFRAIDGTGYLYLVVYSTLCTAGPILLLNLAGLFLPAHETSLLALSQVPFSILAGMIMVHEFPPLITWVGVVFILAAGFLGVRGRSEPAVVRKKSA